MIPDKYKSLEHQYVKHFSKNSEDEHFIRYKDDKLPDMYMHNFILLKEDINPLLFLENEIKNRKEANKTFLRIESYFKIDDAILKQLSVKPEITTYDFMFINSADYKNIGGNTDCEVKEAVTNEILKAGVEIDILSNQDAIGDFAVEKMNRKVEIYQDKDSLVKFYVCFHQNQPIGCCEMMMDDKGVKIEDFDIYKPYQRKGFGTAVVRSLLETAQKNHIDEVYLITDHDDTAKEMYLKCGFIKIGEKYEYFFDLT